VITLDQGGAAVAVEHAPPAELRDVVEAIWVVEGRPAAQEASWRVVADPNPHVTVHRMTDGQVRASVVGARSRYVDVDRRSRSFTVAARLHVGALPLLTRLPVSELLDRGASLGAVFGREGRAVTRRLEDARTSRRAAEALVTFLRTRLEDGERPDWRVRDLMATLTEAPATTMEAVAARLAVSPRTLRETVRDQVGLGPKAVQRIGRLLQGLAAMSRPAPLGGSRAALVAGYADQPHFVHECRRLLGETPGRFLARGASAVSYKRGTPFRSWSCGGTCARRPGPGRRGGGLAPRGGG
jgi:methylphosphotriester-DNA--protein-cysteine methyltransferase